MILPNPNIKKIPDDRSDMYDELMREEKVFPAKIPTELTSTIPILLPNKVKIG